MTAEDKIIYDKGEKIAEEFIAQLKREGVVFKESSDDPAEAEARRKRMEEELEAFDKLLETGIAQMLLKM